MKKIKPLVGVDVEISSYKYIASPSVCGAVIDKFGKNKKTV